MVSKFISNLEKSIEAIEIMELETLLSILRFKNIELRNIVSLLQNHTPTVPLLYSDFIKLEEFPFRIWGVVINLTRQYPKNHDSDIDDLVQIVLDLHNIVQYSVVISSPTKTFGMVNIESGSETVSKAIDLAVIGDAMNNLGGDSNKVNPSVHVDLVTDHSDMARLETTVQTKTEVESATNRFDEVLHLAVGGFRKVYNADLDGGSMKAAIKRGSPMSDQIRTDSSFGIVHFEVLLCMRQALNPILQKKQEWADEMTEYNLFDLMLERNRQTILRIALFIFDPGGTRVLIFYLGVGDVSSLPKDTLKYPPTENKTIKNALLYDIEVTAIFYISLSCTGYTAFGNDASGNVLAGFHEPFWLVDIAIVAVFIHLVGAFHAYVTQDDNLIGTLTVQETIMYSAQLRLPDKMPLDEKRALGCIKQNFPQVSVMALTAAATHSVRNDILDILRIPRALVLETSFDRPNLNYEIQGKSRDTLKQLGKLLIDNFENKCGIVYCLSKSEYVEVSNYLNQEVTYEDLQPFATRLLTFDLEDKVDLEGVGIDVHTTQTAP